MVLRHEQTQRDARSRRAHRPRRRCLAVEATGLGAGEILLTSWDRDGTRAGYDLPMIRAIAAAVSVPIIASGGANSPEHLAEALAAGADAVLAASIFHDGDMTVADVKRELAKRGVHVRNALEQGRDGRQ